MSNKKSDRTSLEYFSGIFIMFYNKPIDLCDNIQCVSAIPRKLMSALYKTKKQSLNSNRWQKH